MRPNSARVTAVAAALFALLVPLIAGALTPNYSHASQYISELGATDMPRGRVVSLLGFLPTGILAATALMAAARAERSPRLGYLLLMFLPLAYLAGAFAPCDPGCPAQGSVSQQVHNLFGAAEYIAGGLGLLVFAGGRRGWSWLNRGLLFAAGLATLVAFVFMTSPYLTESRGLSQRLAETVLFGSLVLIGWRARTK